ncbi:alpha/beta fold hydrolase [Stygiobacter electus]|uniref:Alpha/beta hydrolase n=1 Tax=Stygiobacter electus TaxID=3032292 RepID=A0AAE3TF97_9BACT|nr:alpha/beta hydrolase [Stygiobacter electus]MDF1613158.1 alpha/beta hydrolase [Stygiobacter electus]
MKNTFLSLLLITSLVFSQKIQKAISIDGNEIAFTSQGKGNVSLIFIHGWGCNKNYWKNQTKEFSKNYFVVTLDLAGHGQSTAKRKSYTMNLFGHDVAAVVNQLKLNKVILVAHSLGGAVALEAKKILKDKVIGIIGVDTYQTLDVGETEDRAEQFLSTFKENYKGSVESYLGNLFHDNVDTSFSNSIIRDLVKMPKEIGIDIFRNILKYNYELGVKEAKPKIIVVNGDKFPINLNKVKKVLPTFDYKIVPNTDHFLMLENPKAFNEQLSLAIQEMLKK